MDSKSNTIEKPKAKSQKLIAENYAKVAIDLPLDHNEKYYYYSIPEEIKDEIKIGTIVHVPFGKQEVAAYVLDISEQIFNKSDFNIKPIYEITYSKPIWDNNFLKLAEWISKYYLTNIGTVLGASINHDIIDHYTNLVELIESNGKLTSEQHIIVDKLIKSKKKSLSYRFLLQKTRLTRQRFYQLINQLKNKGFIKTKIKHEQKKEPKSQDIVSVHRTQGRINPAPTALILNKDQQNAYDVILKSIQEETPSAFLLHGVTGSGKTEVYLKLIEEIFKKGKTVIYLVPEIYLITQALERLTNRFNKEEIIVWHSSLSKNERLTNWEKLHYKPKIILGTRSAILTPIKNIGLIVIDEAHDSSYKQASPAPRYDAVKVALKRGKLEGCPVILGTATPNISDYYYCSENQTVLTLPKRIENVPMPEVSLIDMTQEYSKIGKNVLSNLLRTNIERALNNKEQIILLLNRRGYSSHIFCRACGYTQFCKNCTVPLVFHKNENLLTCHHCGYQATNKEKCPQCQSLHFKYFGMGTQLLEEEVKKIFTSARVIRVDRDQLRKKDEYIKLWKDFASHNADILIGTQIVAKGLDLPNVTVVGVILADTMLNFPDYVSYERTFQLLTQVTGRAGRGQKPGKVFIQTYQIDNPIFKFIQEHDFNSFYKKEINQRELFLYPPFTILSRIILQSYTEKDCLDFANEILKELQTISPQVTFLGPAPCFFSKLHNKYRYHILCKIDNEERTNLIFNKLFKRLNKNAKVELIVDIDSVNLL